MQQTNNMPSSTHGGRRAGGVGAQHHVEVVDFGDGCAQAAQQLIVLLFVLLHGRDGQNVLLHFRERRIQGLDRGGGRQPSGRSDTVRVAMRVVEHM